MRANPSFRDSSCGLSQGGDSLGEYLVISHLEVTVMDGRRYQVPRVEAYPLFAFREDGTPYAQPYGYTHHTVYADLIVPNGMWVMERPSFGHTWLIGAESHEVVPVSIDDRANQRRTLYTANKPFGFVQSEEAVYLPGTQVPTGSQRLSYARQVHKGELGKGVSIPRLRFAREHPDNSPKYHNFPRNRDQRRNPFRWARLSNVVAASGASARRLMSSYWPFVGQSYDTAGQRIGEFLHVRFGNTCDDISNQIISHSCFTFEELGNRIMCGQNLDNIWIRAGLANTFLRLIALGYQPIAVPVS